MPFALDNLSPVIRQLPGAVTGIGAGQTAVVKIPTGATYLELIIEAKIGAAQATRAQIEAALTNWRLTVSGIEKFSLTGKQLIAIMEFYRPGSIGDSGFVSINFERLWMSELGGKLNPAYGTLNETSFQLEIEQDGASTIDSIVAWSRIATKAESIGAHVRFARLQPTITGTGRYNYMDLPKSKTEALIALHLEVPVAANLTNIAYIADSVRLVDASQNMINRLYTLTDPTRSPQTAKNFVHLEFANRGIVTDAVPLTMDEQILELTFANAAPNQISVIAELYTPEPAK
jgi:hypothetical protein